MRRIALVLTLLVAGVAQAAPKKKPASEKSAPVEKPAAAPAKPAAAAPAPAPDDPAVAEAKRHFQQAVALYNDGNYSAALAEFEAAYKTRPAPAVLYNIGLTEKALFRYTEAIDSLTRYLKEETKIAPEQRKAAEGVIAEMKALLADVTLTIDPPGASVAVDGRTLGQAPLAVQGIAAGNHTIEVSLEGYKPQKRELLVTAGVPLQLSFKLALIPKTGKVHISASRPQALVRIDGKGYGFAPVDVELPSGGHQLEITAPKYNPYVSELVITAGTARSVDATLSRTSHVYEKWYFWTPLAVVVAGAAVGLGVGLTSREGPIAGTLNPGAGKVN
ncbi:MAG TPA: PEGA domain-containing protein [Polyangia bacterium]|nr:PEGA domain-containing protein [Polyangia bacterium]